MKRIIKFSEAINEALHIAMEKDDNVLCYGLGVGDPKTFLEQLGLQEKFGKKEFLIHQHQKIPSPEFL